MGGPAAGELTRSVYYITTTRRPSTSSITTLPRRRLGDPHQLAAIIQKTDLRLQASDLSSPCFE